MVVKTYFKDDTITVYNGEALEVLRELESESVNTCVTSPPYLWLRDYGTAVWEGGNPDCSHMRDEKSKNANTGQKKVDGGCGDDIYRSVCKKCGAVRIDKQIGLEETMEEYIEKLVTIFREVKRVLHDNGTAWINIGDVYAVSGRAGNNPEYWSTHKMFGKDGHQAGIFGKAQSKPPQGLKPKDLCGIPWRVAFALQQPYHTGCIKHEVDRAWLAGLVDADGSLGIRVQNNSGGQNPTYIPYLTVSCTDVIAIERCVTITGLGKVNIKHKAGSADYRGIKSNRDYYTWRLDGQIASKAIRDIYPFLIIKRLQAQIVYNQNLSLKWGRPTRSKPVPQNVVRYRQQLYETCKLLNQRKECVLPNLKPVDPAIETGWYLRSDIIWQKVTPMPESVNDRPTRSHEYIFLFSKSKKYYYDNEAIKEPCSPNTHPRGNGVNPKTKIPSGWDTGPGSHRNLTGRYKPKQNESFSSAVNGLVEKRNKRSVWTVASSPYPEAHFSTYPPALITPCILAGCPAGGTVLDPFAGSGTTLYVSKELGRKSIGIELKEEYCKLILKRTAQGVLQL